MKERPRQLPAAFLDRIAFDAISGMIAFFALPALRQMKDEDETTTDKKEGDSGAGRVLESEGAAAGPWCGEKVGKDEGGTMEEEPGAASTRCGGGAASLDRKRWSRRWWSRRRRSRMRWSRMRAEATRTMRRRGISVGNTMV